MRQRSLLAALTLMLTSGVHAKNGDTFNGTYVLQGVGSGKLMMLELNGRLLVNADELARGLSRVGWLDASFASGLRTGLVPLTSHGGNRFVDPDAFAKRFGLTLRADHSTRRLLISKGVAGSTAGTKAALPAPTAPSTSRPNVVQGTRQLDGENALPGQTFTVGKSSPLNFTLIRAEFSVGRVVIGRRYTPPNRTRSSWCCTTASRTPSRGRCGTTGPT